MSKLRNKLAFLERKANPQQVQLMNNISIKTDEVKGRIEDLRDSVADLLELSNQYGGEIERVVGGMIYGRLNDFVEDTLRGTEDFSFAKIYETIDDEKEELTRWQQTQNVQVK
ncbi:hypothetical protein D3C81_1169980 [compost metagenome]